MFWVRDLVKSLALEEANAALKNGWYLPIVAM